MERHKCKLCFKNFSNGRALGGHMRSHINNQFSDEIESASSSFSQGDEEQGLSYRLRENPKKSVRLLDPEFSFRIDSSSIVVQDRESQTDSSKNPIRRRLKRNWKSVENQYFHRHRHREENSKNEFESHHKLSKTAESIDPESASSISDSTTENVAVCLMMLSRDKSTKKNDPNSRTTARNEGKFKCETCKQSFRSYQALGGHRASHKKIKTCIANQESTRITGNSLAKHERIYECPICFRVFVSGQALGGHKRSHVGGSDAAFINVGQNRIDLNLPAPFDDEDDISQIEFSALSDAEFVIN